MGGNRTHGLKYIDTKTRKVRPEYQVWSDMKTRCLNPRHKHYKRYGGRGIDVCQEWMSFDNFYNDIGVRPSNKHSLGRLNNNEGYKKSNCCWQTTTEQGGNRKHSIFITYKGVTKSLTEWAIIFGIKRCTLWDRMNRPIKRTFEEALNVKPRRIS